MCAVLEHMTIFSIWLPRLLTCAHCKDRAGQTATSQRKYSSLWPRFLRAVLKDATGFVQTSKKELKVVYNNLENQ